MGDRAAARSPPGLRTVELGALQIGILFGVVLLGAVLQGSVGFGLGMLAAPVVSIIAPQLLPGFVILLAVLVTASAALIERTSIDVRGAGWALAGRIPGSVVGTLLVAWLSDDALRVFVAGTVLLGVGISLRGWTPAATSSNVAIAGVVSGAMGTATGIGGPPMALVWQRSSPATYRATMSAYFLIGTLISLVMLTAAGQVSRETVLWSLYAAPVVLLGWGISRIAARRIDQHAVRLGAMILSVVGALIALGSVIA